MPELTAGTAVAFAAKGKCTVTKGRGFTMISCVLSGRERKIDSSRFEFDPQMGSASVNWNGNKVRWTGRGDLQPDVWEGGSPSGAYGSAGVYRWAPAKGVVLGHKMTKMGKWDSAFLEEGAYADVFVLANGKITRSADGRARANLEYRIPR